MRNISCSHTKDQVRARTKTVTRRLGWKNLKPGTLLRVVEKAMGLKPGEKIVPMAVVRVVEVTRESLNKITPDDCSREGFPHLSPSEFVDFFIGTFGGKRHQTITRIQWRYESRCLQCGFEISEDSSYCGECTCEEDSL